MPGAASGKAISGRCAATAPGGAPIAEPVSKGGPYLVDTSAWIELFRPGRPAKLEAWLPAAEIVTCLPVFQEVLQGIRDEAAYRTMRETLMAFRIVESPLSREVVEEAVRLYRSARQSGVTIRSSVDCLVAACALRHGLTVVHRDRDYPLLARIAPLKTRAV